jgi:hypothetical protein
MPVAALCVCSERAHAPRTALVSMAALLRLTVVVLCPRVHCAEVTGSSPEDEKANQTAAHTSPWDLPGVGTLF